MIDPLLPCGHSPSALTGDTGVATPDATVPIADLVPGMWPGSIVEVDFKVIGLHGVPVRVTSVHHAGTHPVLSVVAGERELRCTGDQPLLSRVLFEGKPRLFWKLAVELARGDLIAMVEPAPVSKTALRTETVFIGEVEPERDVPDAPEVDFFAWVPVELIVATGAEPVYTLRVDTLDQAFVTDGFVSYSTGAGRAAPNGTAARDRAREVVIQESAAGRGGERSEELT